jgi:hypothetical protein
MWCAPCRGTASPNASWSITAQPTARPTSRQPRVPASSALARSTILVYMDGDGADVIANLPRLVEPIVRGEADFVIGSRLRGHREPGSMLSSQLFAARFVGVLLRLVHGVHYTDMGPFRAIRRSSFEQLQMTEMTYGWNLEMQIKAVRHKLRIVEIPVDYKCRIGGVSKVSGDLQASFRAATRIIGVLVRSGSARKGQRRL